MLTPPIIISSPTRRSGTTLIQRLLTSASNTLIYGETCANDFHSFTNIYLSKHLQLMPSRGWRTDQTREVLGGNVNDWIPDLLPDVDAYLENLKSSSIQLLNFFPNYAEKHHRPIWGMKYPEWAPTSLKLIGQLYPDYKVIYIKRNIEDCVRSAKNVDMVRGVTEIEAFCKVWQMNGQSVHEQIPSEKVLYISYESLIKNPEPIIKSMEEFTGAKGIDAKVLDFKFNAFKQTIEKDEPLGKYIDPADLTKEELEVVEKFSKYNWQP